MVFFYSSFFLASRGFFLLAVVGLITFFTSIFENPTKKFRVSILIESDYLLVLLIFIYIE